MESAIIGMCNPLLDITATVDEEFLNRFGLEANNAILADEKHIPMYAELSKREGVEYTAGGAGQNSIRVAQWILQRPQATTYFGAVGVDEYASTMTAKATSEGVNVQYYETKELATGTCAVLVTNGGKCRSLVANLSAANTYQVDHLKADAQWTRVEKANFVYITGFFLTVSPESIMLLGKYCAETGKTFLMNLSAPFLCQVPIFFERMQKALPYVDIYFGNETEARALSEAMGWGTEDVEAIAVKLARHPGKSTLRPRTVVFTQGAQPTIVVVGDENRLWFQESFPVIPIEAKDIVDTNGAGDAFVGGFLAALVQEGSISKSIALGNYAANLIIQRSGCTLPTDVAPHL